MALIEITQLTISFLTLAGILFAVYKYFRDPDINNAAGIKEMGMACNYRHQAIDKDVAAIRETMHLLKVNHINHIETDMRDMRDKQTKILTILEAKYQIKLDN